MCGSAAPFVGRVLPVVGRDDELPARPVDPTDFACSVALRVEWRHGIIGRLSRSVRVDLDAEQRDRVIVDQLSDDDDCIDEAAAGDEVPVVVSLGVERRSNSSKRSPNVSAIVGSSINSKSLADGSPGGRVSRRAERRVR
jgi:hypothetical protein